MKNYRDGIAEMVQGFLLDTEIITPEVRAKIVKALERNCYFTSCYSLQVSHVYDVLGNTPETSGWLILFEGTRTNLHIFVNNNMQVTRKPHKAKMKVVHECSLYNHISFSEVFWYKHFM